MTEPSPKITPMFEQYLNIKKEYPDALLFYRMGDFYELFFDDAVTAARELQITLTRRNRDAASPIPMCGVPWHAVDSYVSQLIDRGFRIAICDQVEDPKASKGLVKRCVTRLLTSGTVVEDANLPTKMHNFLGALFWNTTKTQGGFAWVDISTGEWSGLFSRKYAELMQWIHKLTPRELLIPDTMTELRPQELEGIQPVRVPVRSHFDLQRSEVHVLKAQGVQELATLELDKSPELLRACGALLFYMEQTQKQQLQHLQPFRPLHLGKHLLIDEVTERNLEIFVRLNGRKGKGTLWEVLDQTATPMGGRLLEEHLRHPWRDLASIMHIQHAVSVLFERDALRQELLDTLKQVSDLERLSTRINLNRATPRDFIVLRQSLAALPSVYAVLEKLRQDVEPEAFPPALAAIHSQWDNMEDYAKLLEEALVDTPPAVITEGGLFRSGYHAELDALLDLAEHGEQKLQDMLEAEQQASGIPKLKLGNNRVFGYYFEISNAAQADHIPDYFIRRQTLTNAERFTTPKLKELENSIFSAADKRQSLEYRLFQELREKVAASRPRILAAAARIASLDYWQSLASVARRWTWTAPTFSEKTELYIREGRHPVVEAMMGSADFVPNDLNMDAQRRFCLITGPNMAGKSTILRQTAIICILAQMGSFVPAQEARLRLVDRVFSRVGASDNLTQGQSTFMVEMMETARILRQASQNSLVILDEIGRGTSTYDGLALAWAVVEELARKGKGNIRTLFATHYHELTSLEGHIPGLFTMNIAIREWNGDILFLHRLVPGPSDRSYGIEVARLAGVPGPVVQRARELLHELEHSRSAAVDLPPRTLSLPGLIPPNVAPPPPKNLDMTPPPIPAPHPLVQLLRDLDPDTLTPLAALKLLSEWKLLWGLPVQEKNAPRGDSGTSASSQPPAHQG